MMPELSVIISGLNEEPRVKNVLGKVLKIFNDYKINGELVFLNNHSSDDTGKIADTVAQNNPRLKVIHRYNRPNKDLGSSLKEGIQNAASDFFLIMDCDLSHDPRDIPKLFDKRNQADIIIGSRYVKKGSAELTWQRRLLSRTYNNLAKLISGVPVYDLTTGFKLYRKKTVENINVKTNGFGFHVELPIRAFLAGATFLEIPIHYQGSPKKSTLSYRKQFFSYMGPVFWGGWQRIRKVFSSNKQ